MLVAFCPLLAAICGTKVRRKPDLRQRFADPIIDVYLGRFISQYVTFLMGQ